MTVKIIVLYLTIYLIFNSFSLRVTYLQLRFRILVRNEVTYKKSYYRNMKPFILRHSPE